MLHARIDALAAGLDPMMRTEGSSRKGVKQAHRVRAAADRGDDAVGQPPSPSCAASWARVSRPMIGWKVAHHRRIGMRAGDGADAIEGVAHIGHPVAQASFIASLSVPRPLVTGTTSAPRSFMRKTFGA